MKLTVVFGDYRIASEYANGVFKSVDFWTDHGDHFVGNTTTKEAFISTVLGSGHNMQDYWAIQYFNGDTEIEYANGHPNRVISGNTEISGYISNLETWNQTIKAEVAEAERLASIPTWDDIRLFRDGLLLNSDAIIVWSTETGNAVPQDWTDYRQELRDITVTFGAPTGNTELVVFPDKPSWPTA